MSTFVAEWLALKKTRVFSAFWAAFFSREKGGFFMKVKYEFVNETVEVEVDEQWATVIAELDRRDYNNNKK